MLTINQDSAMLCYRFHNGGSDYHRKTLGDVDNVCALIANASDYVRLQYHLTKYSMVFNAKFNQEKKEAFALSGHLSEPWRALME